MGHENAVKGIQSTQTDQTKNMDQKNFQTIKFGYYLDPKTYYSA